MRFLDVVLIGICSAHINEMSQERSSLLSCLGSPRKLIHGLGAALPSPNSLDSRFFFSFCWICCMFRPHREEMWSIVTYYSGWKDADAIVTRKPPFRWDRTVVWWFSFKLTFETKEAGIKRRFPLILRALKWQEHSPRLIWVILIMILSPLSLFPPPLSHTLSGQGTAGFLPLRIN